MNGYETLMARIQSEAMNHTQEDMDRMQRETRALTARAEALATKRCFCNRVKFTSLCKVCREA